MADPLAGLRAPSTPVDPDPGFAASLRSRLRDALDPRQGATVPDLTAGDAPDETAATGPVLRSGPHHGDLGYVSLWVPDVDRAAVFFATVLGWTYGAASGPQGRRVEGRALHHGLWGGVAPATLFLCAAVDDVHGAVRRVRAGGGTAGEPHPEPYGLVSECMDDQGVPFAVFEPPGGTGPGRPPASAPPGGTGPGRPPASAPPGPVRHGDVVYVTMEVVDSSRARSFYGAVLGWRFTPGRVEDGWQVAGVTPLVGLSGGHPVATAVPMYQVDDIGAAVHRVRLAGGTATEPATEPYGTASVCADDQGTRFHLVTLAHP